MHARFTRTEISPCPWLGGNAALLRMHAVLGFVPHHGLRAIDHIGHHFFATVRGQAVHEEGIGLGGGHHLAVHEPVGKGFFSCVVFSLKAHAGPHVGGYKVSADAGLHRVFEDCITVAGADARDALVYFVAAGRAQVHLGAQDLAGLQPGVGRVVAVTDSGHGFAAQERRVRHAFGIGAPVLKRREDVCQYLAWMELVGQAVDHRHSRAHRQYRRGGAGGEAGG